MQCDELVDLLPAVADGTTTAPPDAQRHVESCLRCQAELVQYRKLLRALHNLRHEVLAPAPGMLPELLASLHDAGERRAVRSMLSGRRLAYASGIAAATAAGAAGAILYASRSRRRLAG